EIGFRANQRLAGLSQVAGRVVGIVNHAVIGGINVNTRGNGRDATVVVVAVARLVPDAVKSGHQPPYRVIGDCTDLDADGIGRALQPVVGTVSKVGRATLGIGIDGLDEIAVSIIDVCRGRTAGVMGSRDTAGGVK